MVPVGDAGTGQPTRMAVLDSRSASWLPRFTLGLCLRLLLLLPSPSRACPKPCACYVPTEVHCTFRYLTAMPGHISANVERINMGYNSLSELTENDFSGLNKLELLMLHSNEIQQIHEKAFSELHSLQVLKMSYNKVRNLHKNTFHGLKSLIRLHMDHNKIEFLNPDALYGLTSLKLVHLEGNLLTQLHTDTFVTLRYMQIFKTSSIKHIYLSDNLISSLPKDMFSYMPELESVYLHGNPWSCDCYLQWFAEWAEQSREMIKCRRDRSYPSGQQCPVCSKPSQYKGKDLSEISAADLSCVKPFIDPTLKLKNATSDDEGDFTSISPKDFIAPIGSLILNMTDQSGNEANLACSIQRPSKMSPLTLERSSGHTVLRTSFSTFLVCNIDYDHIQKLWGIMAMYSDSPMKLRRDLLLTTMPYVSYNYKQISSEDDVFTNIEAELRAEPSWLMQDQITLQLDRTATTLNTLHVRYIADAHIILASIDEKPMRYKWAMILKDNTTKTEYSVMAGGTVELDCQVIGEPTPAVEWILPDGSKVRSPYTSEEGRIILTKSGKFILRAVDSFDTGAYHCIGTNYHDADVLTFRIVVVDPDVEHETVNGGQFSPFIGDSLYLPCHSTGIPEASVSWILPDHSVIHQSSRYQHIFSNGTLKIQQLTERDRGYFRCLAANQYGFDVLVVKVLTEASENDAGHHGISVTEDGENEGSGNKGNEEFTVIKEHYMPLTTVHSIISQTSTVTPKKLSVSKHHVGIDSKIQYNKKGDTSSKRARGQRRQFNHSNRRIDPQRWAALLEKTKKKSITSPIKENSRANTEKEQENHSENVSGDGEETSGDDVIPIEEGFVILTTKVPTETTISELSQSKMTKETQTASTEKFKTTLSMIPHEISPVVRPRVIPLERYEQLMVSTDQKHTTAMTATQRMTTLRQSPTIDIGNILSQELETLSTISNVKSSSVITRQSTASNVFNVTSEDSSNRTSTIYSMLHVTSENRNTESSTVNSNSLLNITSTNMDTMPTFTSRVLNATTNDLNRKDNFIAGNVNNNYELTSETPSEEVTTVLTTFQGTSGRSESLNTTSTKSSHEISLMTVTEPKNELGHIYFQSTQKIITPGLPPGSAIITHQQIQIIRGVTPNTPNAKQRYGRRRISGKRRIVRPDRIPNIRDRYKYFRPGPKDVTRESKTVTLATELGTTYQHSSSTSSLDGPVPLPTPSTTTVSPTPRYTAVSPTPSTTTVIPTPSTTTVIPTPSTTIVTPTPVTTAMTPTPSTTIMTPTPSTTTMTSIPNTTTRTPQTMHTQEFTTATIPTVYHQYKEGTIKPENTGPQSTHIFSDVTQHNSQIIQGFVSPVSTRLPTTATDRPSNMNIYPTISTQGSNVYLDLKSKLPTTKSRNSSKTSRGKIPWHRFFGNSHIQKEILKKVRKPKIQTARSATTIGATTSFFETGTLPVSEVFTSYLTTASEITENHTDMPASLTKRTMLDNAITLRAMPTLSTFTVGTSSPTYYSSLAPLQIKEMKVNSFNPTSTFSSATTSDNIPTRSATEMKETFSTKTANAARRKGLKRRRPRKKNTTHESVTVVQWSTSATLPVKGSSQMTTQFERLMKSSISLLNNLPSENATAIPFAMTHHQQRITPTAETMREPPTSQAVVSTNTTYKTLPNKPYGTFIRKLPLSPPSPDPPGLKATDKFKSSTVTHPKSNTKNKHESIQYTTKGMPAYKSDLVTSTHYPTVSTHVMYPNLEHSTPLSPVLTVTPPISTGQSTSSPQWQPRHWNKSALDLTERGRTLIVNTLTVLKSSQSLTSHTPVIKKDNYYSQKQWSHKTVDQEATTMNLLSLETLPSSRPTKPRIMGGKVASFTVLVNSDAFIPCEATGNPFPTIHWTKVSSGTFLSKSRRGNKLEKFVNGTLSIPSVSIHDRGQYLCVATNRYGSDRLLVTLSVVAYPPRILDGQSKDITVHSGNSVEVKCQAEGRPIPEIVWILANKSSVSEYSSENHRVSVRSDGTLTIKEVTIYDRGIYKCLANNPAGADTLTVKIQVIAAPPIILEDKRQKIEGRLGENVKIPCTAKGNPNPSVHWVLFDGTEVKPLQFINAKLFMFSNGTLYIRNLVSADSGNYECIATSSTGSERRVISLTVEQSDTIPKIVTASPKFTERNFGDQLLLNCSATGEPKPRIIWRLPSKAVVDQWHRMGSRIHVYPNGSLFVDAVTEKDAGDYLCVARNKIGDDLILMRVSVTLKPAKIDQKQYFKKQVPYGKDFKVDCKASGSPMPEISWSLPDGTMINNVLQADDNGRSRFRRYVLFENGTLFLNKVGITEEGDYTCFAQNTLGKDEMKVHITVVTAAPRIKQNYKTFASVKAREMATFDCEATGEPRPRIFWLLPSSDMISASSDRYLLHVNGSLSISKVKLLDAGEYMCVARNPAGDDTKLFKLEVVSRPPLINGLYTNKTIIKDTAVKHSKKLINCRAEGTPPPQVMWIMPDNIFLTAPYYGSRIIVHKNGTLEIRNVRASDTAEFICVARNDEGETVLVVQLEAVDMLRRPMFKNPFNEKVTAKPEKTAILNCSADGNPPPEMIWLLPNGTRFSSGRTFSRYQIGSNGTFIIYNPTREDAGKYRCAARNTVGYIEKLIILEVGQKPTILTRPRKPIKTVSGEQLSLHCLSDGVPKPNIIWTVPSGFVIDRPQINGRYMLHENGTLVVREASIHDRGNYICRAQNNAGDMTITVPVTIVAYPPRITNRPPQSMQTKVGAAVQLNCMAIGIPKPEISWELPDRSVLSTASKGRPAGSELLHPQGTLVIQNPRSSDSGTYRCTAKNQLGSDVSATYIQVI